MKRHTGVFLDSLGNPKPNATVKVVATGTTAPAALTLNGVSIANPLTTDAYGRFVFEVISGIYDFLDASDQMIQAKVQIFDFANPNEWLNPKNIPIGAAATPFTNVGDAIEALVSEALQSGSFGTPPSGVTVQAWKSSRIYAVKWRIPYTALTSLPATSGGILLGQLPARFRTMAWVVELATQFAASGLTAFNISVGGTQGGGAANFMSQGNMLAQGAAPFVYNGTIPNPQPVSFAGINSPANAWFNVVSTGANLSALTAGQLDLTMLYLVLP